jgi:hypothetical protein
MTAVVLALAGAATGILILKLLGLGAFLVYLLFLWGGCGGWVVQWQRRAKRLTLSNIILVAITWSGIALLGLNYFLAYSGQTATLETLGGQVITVMLGGVISLTGKAAVENIYKGQQEHKRKLSEKDNDAGRTI